MIQQMFGKMFGQTVNPMNAVNNMVKANPQLQNAYNMAMQITQGKSPEEIEKVANNLLSQNNMNLNDLMSAMQKQMGGNTPKS